MAPASRRLEPIFLLTLLTLFALPRCRCEEGLSALRPKVRVTPADIDFGRRAVGQAAEAAFTVGNTGTAPASCAYAIGPLAEEERAAFGGVFDDTEGAAFAVAAGPEQVGVNQSADGRVQLTPPGRGRYGGVLLVRCDDPDAAELRVPLVGEGGPPLIEADPDEVDFGVVNEGPGAARAVRLVNIGFDTLTITSLVVEDDFVAGGGAGPPVFSFGEAPPEGATLLPGEAISVQVRMDPSAAAVAAAGDLPLTGTLRVESNAEDQPSLAVPLSGGANLAPVAVAVELFSRRSTVKVGLGSDVVIDGNDTVDPEGDPFTFRWELVEVPVNSQAFLVGALAGEECATDAECATTEGYRCIAGTSSSRCRQVARTRVAPDAVGSFVVRLIATDSRGAYASADATILPRDLALVLTWREVPDAPCYRPGSAECEALDADDQRLFCCGQTDIDLHLVRPGGSLGDYGSCPAGCIVEDENRCLEPGDDHVASCRQAGSDCAYANRSPEWGEAGRLDDPRLDIDDVRGFGPEVITLNEPVDGVYTAVVHFCEDRIGEPTDATLDVYVEGELVHSAGPQRLDAEGRAWIAASLVRSGGPDDGAWSFVSVPDLFDEGAPGDLCQR